MIGGLKHILATNDNKNPELMRACAFDRHLRHDGVAETLLQFLLEDIASGEIPEDPVVLCSGKFGELVKQHFKKFMVIQVPGNLRKPDSVDPVIDHDLMGRICVFVDDALYSCATEARTVRAANKQGGKVVKAYFGYEQQKGLPIRKTRSIVQRSDIYE